jgi:hypothetical protein
MTTFSYNELIAEAKKVFAKANEFVTAVTVIIGKKSYRVARNGEDFSIIG